MTGALGVAVGAAAVAAWLLTGSPRAQARRASCRSTPASATGVWVRGRLLAGAGAFVVGWMAADLVTTGLAPVIGAACAALGFWWYGRLEPARVRSRRSAAADDLPITLEMVAACVEAGAPVRAAVRQVCDLAPGGTRGTLDRLDAEVGLGVDEATAWRRLGDDPVWGAVARDLARAIDTGVPAREVLQEHAADARAARHGVRLARARAVGVRSTLPLMLCFLPAFLLLGVVPIVAGLIPHVP